MKWLADPDAEREFFGPGASTVRPLRWDDWAPMNATAYLPAAPDEELPRSWTFNVRAQGGGVEGVFQQVQRSLARRAAITALALESAHGATVGWAVLEPDPLALSDGWRLDLYVHPAFRDGAGPLLRAVPWPERGRVAAYTTPATPPGYRAAALAEAGFQPVAELPGWLKRDGQPAPLLVYARSAP
jgi:hypothetical protein